MITEKRIQNVIDTFPGISWNKDTVKITIEGRSKDKPVFQIEGKIKETINGENVDIRWHSATPGGGYSRLYYRNSTKDVIVRTSLRNGKKAFKEIIKNLRSVKTS